MLSYSRLQPTSVLKLKDAFLEAGAFGIVNLVLLWPVLLWFADSFSFEGWEEGIAIYLVGIAVILVAPVAWAVMVHLGLGWLERKNWILRRPKTAWDAFFLKKVPAKIIVRMKDASMIGGQFGGASYASLSPQSGHLYIEKAWKISEAGEFVEPIRESLGLVLRPEDYAFVELFAAAPDVEKLSEGEAEKEIGNGE